MIDWDEVAAATDADELREAKLWLFQENIRLENERRDLETSREKYMKERISLQRELDELFPWDFIDAGVTKEFLLREWNKACAQTVTPNCRMNCSGCGARKYGGGVCFENKN